MDLIHEITTGEYNTAVGNQSLKNTTTGDLNTAVGQYALLTNSGGNNNTANGAYSLRNNTTGGNNTAIGSEAMYNVCIGESADFHNQTGSNNTIIGYEAGKNYSNHSKSGNVFIGYQAGMNETGSNKLYIQNSGSVSPLIGGDFTADEVYINGTIKITGGNPGAGKVLTSDANGNATWQVSSAPLAPLHEIIIELQLEIEMLKAEMKLLKEEKNCIL